LLDYLRLQLPRVLPVPVGVILVLTFGGVIATARKDGLVKRCRAEYARAATAADTAAVDGRWIHPRSRCGDLRRGGFLRSGPREADDSAQAERRRTRMGEAMPASGSP
jgi:hypothetical protein